MHAVSLMHVCSLPRLRCHGVPFILLTATLPPAMMQDLCTAYGTIPEVIRVPTPRPNIQHSVELLPDRATNADCMARIEALVRAELRPGMRIIVYCRAVKEAKDLHAQLERGCIQAALYHGAMMKERDGDAIRQAQLQAERDQVRQAWQRGDKPVMVATSAFAYGINHPGVRLVINLGMPSSLIEFAQQAGRAGRDGQPARSMVVTTKASLEGYVRFVAGAIGGRITDITANQPMWADKAQKLDLPGQARQAMDWALERHGCRRQTLQSYLDGTAVSCLGLGKDTAWCDLCQLAMGSGMATAV